MSSDTGPISNDPEALARIIEDAAASGDSTAVDSLTELVLSPDVSEPTRNSAAIAIAGIQNASGHAFLLDLLHHDDARFRGVAVYALGALKTPDSVAALIDALRDRVNTVRNQAERSLLGMTDLVRQHGIDKLIGLLSHDVALSRSPAARILGNSQSERALQPLLSMLTTDQDWLGRMWAARALGDLGMTEAFDVLTQTCRKDEKNRVRAAATESIGQIRADGCEEVLRSVLEDEDEGVRNAADEALRAIGMAGFDDESDPFSEE